jgi:hypothetical protein
MLVTKFLNGQRLFEHLEFGEAVIVKDAKKGKVLNRELTMILWGTVRIMLRMSSKCSTLRQVG